MDQKQDLTTKPITEVTLLYTGANNEIVEKRVPVRTRITNGQLKRFQHQDLLPKSFFKVFSDAEQKPEVMEPYMASTVYAAYLAANPSNPMSQEEFDDHLELDLETQGRILAQVFSKPELSTRMAMNFKRSTRTKKHQAGRNRK